MVRLGSNRLTVIRGSTKNQRAHLHMLYAVRRLGLGLALIAVASSILLFADRGRRVAAGPVKVAGAARLRNRVMPLGPIESAPRISGLHRAAISL